LDVVTKNLAMTLGTTLSETLATFSTYKTGQYILLIRAMMEDNSRPVMMRINEA
jgi:hypothetical protein